jgi:hypothetical protein
MPGQLFLNDQLAPKVAGDARPLAPGEYLRNPDGSWSSEVSATIGAGEYPDLNGGRPTLIPTMWLMKGVPTRVDRDTAARLAAESGLSFRSFNSDAEAEKFSQDREDAWQRIPPERASSVPALWETR